LLAYNDPVDALRLRDSLLVVAAPHDDMNSIADSTESTWGAMMAIIGYTHTQAPLPPPTDPFKPNDNVVVSPFSVFYGGAITEHIGAFAQVTHNAPPPGGFPDPFGHTWTWDNVDLRYANTAKLGGRDDIYGITANNNPTVQDVWNTTPAWTFPYASSTAPTPGTKVLIDATFAAHLGGVGGYVFVNDMLYLEATGYSTLNFREQNSLGTDPFSAPGLFDGARAAFESHWANHWLEIGTFGMFAAVHPWADTVFFTPRHVPANRQIHRHRLRLAISIPGRELLVHVARQLHS
jgi:hypothetical protein